jgi:hypothetical protein
MNIRELEELGVPEKILHSWESSGFEELTELQLCLEVFEQSRDPQSLLDVLTTQRGYCKS